MKHSLRSVVFQTEERTRCLSGGQPRLIPLGFRKLDTVIGGLSPGMMGTLGALDGTGKSTISLLSAFERSENGLKTAVVSLQDSPDTVGMRLLSHMTGVNGLKMRRGDLSEQERAQLIRAAGRLEDNECIHTFFPEAAGLGAVAHAIREAAEAGCDLVWLDYIQQVFVDNWRGDRRVEIDRILATLQSLCHELQVSLMILSQMRKLPPKRGSSSDEPVRDYSRMDLKESGAIGEQSRLVLILERDKFDEAVLHMTVDKSTFGGDFLTLNYRRAATGLLEAI